MADINIENFYKHIAKIFNILYGNFPSKQAIYVDEIAGIDEPDEYGLHSPHYTAGFYALMWLEEEGYLRYTDLIHQDGVDQACLSHRAFMCLTEVAELIYDESVSEPDLTAEASPSIIEDHKLVINQLRQALNSGSSIAVNKVVRHILTT